MMKGKSKEKVVEKIDVEENQQKLVGRVIYDRNKTEGVNLIHQYFELQLEFEKRYGPNTVVMMQVGDFFEFYGVDNDKEKIGNLVKISEVMNIILSRRNKAILENSRENPQFCGFPFDKMSRFLNVLLTNNYTVVMVEQVHDRQGTNRVITAIHSPGTYIDEVSNSDPNHVMSIFIEEEKAYKTGVPIYFVGMASIDLSTGSCTVYQKQNHLYDKMAVMEDMYRFMESYNPKEIVIYYGELKTITVDEIMDHLNTNSRIFHLPIESNEEWGGKFPLKYQQVLYQNQFFGKVYPEHGFYAPIEYIGLERMSQAALAFLMLLEFAHEHNISILRKVQKPELWEYPQHLILYHNTMYQLNIISQGNVQQEMGYGGSACWRKGSGGGSRYKSLLDVIQKTSTAMGKRLLKYRLMNPLTSSEELEKRYDWTEKMMQKKRYEECQKRLMEMMDMERMHRKMNLGMIHPHEFGSLHMTYDKVLNLMEWMEEEGILADYKIEEETMQKFREYRMEYQKDLNMTEIHKHSLQAITDNFFMEGIVPELDEVQGKINAIMKYFDETVSHFSNLIEGGSDAVKWDMNARDGYFMVCTKKRCDVLEKKMTPEERKKWDIKKLQATTVKITGDEWDKRSFELISLKERMRVIAKEKYLELMQRYVVSYHSTLHEISGFIACVDVVKSAALCAKMYGYHRPKIEDRYEGKSYFSSKKMRHPLIEVLHEKVVYVDNDIELLKGGDETGGILLMGLNGVGKSSMAKAIGCNIVMAQMGYFVACSEFVYYPYEKIFTRINGDDNIFKGMSSFVVEMSELRSILKYADDRSIVLGDEVCKGTEETSALSIVSATIQRFSEKGVNFIMATHFHKLCEMEEIQKLKNVVFKHLSVSYDEEGDKIIYGRKLMDGPGDTLYGLEIARHLIKDDEFFQIARKTRNKIVKESDEVVEMKRSNYHSQLIMTECMICKKTHHQTTLQTHHLKEQHEYGDEVMNIDGVRKDQLGNLVVLCEEHHEEVHHGELEIEGWRDTVSGRELVWKKREKKEDVVMVDPLDLFEDEIERMRKSGMERKLMVNQIFARMKGSKVSKKQIEKKIQEMSM